MLIYCDLLWPKESTACDFMVNSSDESEPNWLEPQLELKDFQLGSAQLVIYSCQLKNQKSAKTSQNFNSHLKTYFWSESYINYVGK